MTLNFRLFVLALLLISTTSLQAQYITTLAGTGTASYSGDGGPASVATVNDPRGAAADGSGTVFIADYANNRLRQITTGGVMMTLAGTGVAGFSGDGSTCTAAQLNGPAHVAIDGSGNIYIADKLNNRIRKISVGVIHTFCGTGTAGFSGDGGAATAAQINQPTAVAVDVAGNVYIADNGNNRIRVVNSSGTIYTYAGTGTTGFSGDGGPATAAMLNNPTGVAKDGSGNVYIADNNNHRIRRVGTSGIITTYAGTGTSGFSGDGGPATAAKLSNPYGVTVDPSGNLYIADYGNARVRKVNTSGVISTFAGTGVSGYSGDGGAATAAMVRAFNVGMSPTYSIVYICEGTGNRVRQVDTNVIVAPITGPSTVCVGATITLADAVPGGTWASSTTAIATINPVTGVVTGVSAGVVTITYTVSSSIATHTVTVSALPSVSASATSACGGVYTVTATGASAYSWSPSTGLSCTTCSSATVYPMSTVTYTVTGTSTAGCSATSTVLVDGNRINGHLSFTGTGTAKVWLIKFNWTDSSILALDSTTTCTTSGGEYYEFAHPASGNYRIKAYLLGGTPGTSGYIPTYGISSPNWYLADTLVHSTGSDSMHINLIYGTVPSGPGFISGFVVSGAGKGTSGEVPAVGMLVFLKNTAGNVLTYTYTDGSGAYTFSGLAYGSYIVYPEDYKYYTTPSSTIVLSASSPSASAINFKQHTSYGTITPFFTTAVPSVMADKDIAVYPNPSKEEITVTGIKEVTGYRLMDITGTLVNSGTLQPGGNVIDVHNLATGVYLLELAGAQSEKNMIRIMKE